MFMLLTNVLVRFRCTHASELAITFLVGSSLNEDYILRRKDVNIKTSTKGMGKVLFSQISVCSHLGRGVPAFQPTWWNLPSS